MKLLMENWRKFINEMEDVGETTKATPEQESKTEEVLDNIKTNEDKVLEFFKNNPEIAEKIVKVAEEENTELNEEEKPSNTEMVSSLATFAGAATTLMGTLGIISGGSYFDDTTLAQMIVGGLGVAGVSKIVNALAKVAKKSKSEDTEELEEKKLTKPEAKEKEKIVKGMKSTKKDFEERYPGRGEEVMYATATKIAQNKKKKKED